MRLAATRFGRSMAGRRANHHLLNQHPDHRDVLLLQVLISGVPNIIKKRVDDQLDHSGIVASRRTSASFSSNLSSAGLSSGRTAQVRRGTRDTLVLTLLVYFCRSAAARVLP